MRAGNGVPELRRCEIGATKCFAARKSLDPHQKFSTRACALAYLRRNRRPGDSRPGVGDMDDSPKNAEPKGSWKERYGEKHRWRRYSEWPRGIEPPAKVRIYERAGHYLLNWWDPAAGKNLSERVDGDLLIALAKAREIDGRLAEVKTAGPGRRRRIGHAELVERFLDDLGRRADAGEVAAATVGRYRSALAHFLAYSTAPEVARAFPTAASADRTFRLGFNTFLQSREVSGNGRRGAAAKRMSGRGIVADTVRALYEWAGDGERGGLLPEGFRNPFLRSGGGRTVLRGDPLAEPDITMAMAADFLGACDDFELAIFVPLILFGLRAAEPCFLFREHLLSDWLLVPNLPGLDYTTKGRRDKRFPLPVGLEGFWNRCRNGHESGPLFVRRAVADGRERPEHVGKSLTELEAVYRERKAGAPSDAAGRLRLRNRLFADAGGIAYGDIEKGFHRVGRKLGWPPAATVKDFRHLFATTLANAGLPEGYRKYVLGHAPGRDAAVAYTHLNRLKELCADIYARDYAPVLEVIRLRTAKL